MKNLFYSVGEKSFEYYSNARTVTCKSQHHKCINCGKICFEPIMPPFDYMVQGKRLGDIMSVLPGYYLVSKNVYELFEINNISGVSFSKEITCIEWHDRKGMKINQSFPNYYYMIIEGKCGDVILSNGKSIPKCPDCNSLRCSFGIKTAFYINDWDGSDVFTHNFATGMICTEKVKNLVEKSNLKNFDFKAYRCTSKKQL